jgi:hypothetical protein
MYKRKNTIILIMIIPMLAVEPKLLKNVLALCSLISHLHLLFSILLVTLGY